MKPQLPCFALAALLVCSCGKSEKKTDDRTTTEAPPSGGTPTTIAEQIAAARPNTAPSNSAAHAQTGDAARIRAAGTSPQDSLWDTLTDLQKVEQFNAQGIAGVPQHVAAGILKGAANLSSPDDQLRFIIAQSAAWMHVDRFMEKNEDMPDQRKSELQQSLQKTYGDSWQDAATELDAQAKAYNQIMSLRLSGIPGLSPDESQDFLIHAIERFSPDYKRILAIAEQRARDTAPAEEPPSN